MLFFYAQIVHDHVPTVRELLESYISDEAAYIIAKETSPNSHKETNGEHLHFAVDMSKKQYDAFRNTVLVKKYGLRGKAQKDLPKQYGTVKNVRDEMKMLSYTVKDQNIIYRNIDLKTIQGYIEKSFKKNEKVSYQEELMDYLKTFPSGYFFQNHQIFTKEGIVDEPQIDFRKIQAEILQHWVLNCSKPLSRCQLQFYTNLYLQFHFKEFKDYVYEIIGFINGKL